LSPPEILRSLRSRIQLRANERTAALVALYTLKAIADENEELGGALPRNYNSLEKPILRELLKILVMRFNNSSDSF